MILQDLRYSVRALARSRFTTATVIAVLALGIGANTALFSVLDAVLLRPLNYPQPDRIVELLRKWPTDEAWATSPTKFDFWRRENRSLDAIAAHSFGAIGLNLVGHGEPRLVLGLAATDGYFRVLGSRPFLGRTYTAQEDLPGAGHYVVLSYGLWQRLFNGDRSAVGKSLSLSNDSYQILGVMPPGFDSPEHPDLWVPLQLHIDPSDRASDYAVIGRLKPEVSVAAAQADFHLVGDRFRKAYGTGLMSVRESIRVAPFRAYLIGDAGRPLWILMGAVGLVLLIACANVANLLLARSTSRRREMAVRVALGASAFQIVRQLLIESLLMAVAGALCGWAIASFSLPVMLKLAPADLPQIASAGIDGRVLLFTLAVAMLTALIFGFFPALQSAQLGIANPLREAGFRTTGSAGSQRIRQALVVAEVAVSLILLIGAALLIRTVINLRAVHPGFDPRHVIVMRMGLDSRYYDGAALQRLNTRIMDRLRTIPGVLSAASAGMPPMTAYFDLPFEIVGRPVKNDEMPDERYRLISPGYFSTLNIPLLEGREFTADDTSSSAPVIIVSREFAEKYFPRQSALGQQILVGRIIGPDFADKPRRIVGVSGGLHDSGLNRPAPPEMFEPESQAPAGLLKVDFSLVPLNWLIRTAGEPMALAETIRREALTATGDVPLSHAEPLSLTIDNSLARERFLMALLTIFAGLAVLLGMIGLYGVIAYSVAQRTRELGVRSALGARRGDLLRLVVGSGMRLAGLGLVLGLAGALALTRFLASLLYGVRPSDPGLFASITLFLAAIALTASFVPAYRASRVDPVVALRDE
jgi:putative ABC transport system permease protein